jgi:hypothetical protein
VAYRNYGTYKQLRKTDEASGGLNQTVVAREESQADDAGEIVDHPFRESPASNGPLARSAAWNVFAKLPERSR